MKKITNPQNPFHSVNRELLEPPSDARTEIYEDATQSILTPNDSPDLSFKWSVNPYRGCFHSCAYCYARRYHEYLDFGAGTDFETKLVIKKDAPKLLEKEFRKKSWKGELVVFSGATDCYQPIEAVYKLTQQCLRVCADFRNPVGLITKSFLITRDVELLAEIHRLNYCSPVISIPFASDDLARKIEPQAATVKRRFEAIKILSKAGMPVGVSLAPTIPGLNDNDIPIILKKAKDAGATFAFHSMVRLAGSVRDVFEQKIRAVLPPERVERVLNRIRETRGGKMNESEFGSRMKGSGTYWDSISSMFRVFQEKYGMTQAPDIPEPSRFRVPTKQAEFDFS